MTIKAQPITRPGNASKLSAMLSTKDKIDVEYAHQDSVLNRHFSNSKIKKAEWLKKCH